MAPEDNQDDQSHPIQPAQLLADLTARVESLERQLAELRATPLQAAPPPPRIAPNRTRHLPKPTGALENRIGSQLFSRIGIIALLIAVTLFLKWAIDNHWIGPLGRILAGLVAGAAVVLWSERFRHKGFNAFSYALKAIGTGALYLSLWAAFQLYHLLPAGAALGAMILVTAWNAFMAWSQNSQVLAAYALAGALATPLLLSSGGDHEIFLFLYLLAIDIAVVTLVRLKPWPRLLFGAFPATVAYFIAWYVEWYEAYTPQHPLTTTSLFIALFFVTFLVPSLARKSNNSADSITEVLLPLANATFTALALYSVLEDANYHAALPWVAVLLAAIYLVLMRLPQPRVTSAVHLALAIVLLTIAIPLKVSGHWITIGWLAEGVALLWVAARLSIPRTDPPPNPALDHIAPDTVPRTLKRLAIVALSLGFCGLLLQPLWIFQHPVETPFLNLRFATALFGVAALAISAALAWRAHRHENSGAPSWLTIAGASTIALNLVAILACVRELETAWNNATPNSEADLQRSLAISGFLMLYGAGLLAVGFWKRSAFIRWQALVLLVFSIVKTFLYDMRDLSQGYRILSFLGLGALLMAISFAYQKDWLSLRDPQPLSSPSAPAKEGADQ
jgi:uncharacterized membrane protein